MNKVRVTFQTNSKLITLITIENPKIHSIWNISTITSTQIVIATHLMACSEQRISEMRTKKASDAANPDFRHA
jgi:hypothetical protein